MISISNMTINDFELIKNILHTDFDDFWKPETFKSELLNENSKYIVAKRDGEILGFAGIWKSVDDVHITNIAVRKDSRNQGIATLLLEKLIEISKDYNYFTSITLEVRPYKFSCYRTLFKTRI